VGGLQELRQNAVGDGKSVMFTIDNVSGAWFFLFTT
jgi:hypothetical protein